MMRRLLLLVVTGALMATLTAAGAFAQRGDHIPETEQNEIYGTGASETIYGTYGADLIAGFGGHDLIVGEAGADTLLAGTGDDYIVAGYGWWQAAPNAPASPDFIQAGPGNDLIDAADVAGAPDDVRCGPGSDLVYAGVEDNVATDCEFVYRYYGF